MRGIAAVLILLPLAEPPLAADDIQSWTDIELRVLEAGRIAWTVGGVARIRDALGSAYDRRAQTDVDVALSDHLTATVGYILRHHVPAGSGLRLEPSPARRADLPAPAGECPAGRHHALRTPRRPAGRARLQPLPPADRRRAPPRPGVAVALPVGGVRTPGLRALPLADGRPLALHLGSLGPGRVPVRVDQGGRELATAARHLLGVELRSDGKGNGRAVGARGKRPRCIRAATRVSPRTLGHVYQTTCRAFWQLARGAPGKTFAVRNGESKGMDRSNRLNPIAPDRFPPSAVFRGLTHALQRHTLCTFAAFVLGASTDHSECVDVESSHGIRCCGMVPGSEGTGQAVAALTREVAVHRRVVPAAGSWVLADTPSSSGGRSSPDRQHRRAGGGRDGRRPARRDGGGEPVRR